MGFSSFSDFGSYFLMSLSLLIFKVNLIVIKLKNQISNVILFGDKVFLYLYLDKKDNKIFFIEIYTIIRKGIFELVSIFGVKGW